jgi:hypothetical protein
VSPVYFLSLVMFVLGISFSVFSPFAPFASDHDVTLDSFLSFSGRHC